MIAFESNMQLTNIFPARAKVCCAAGEPCKRCCTGRTNDCKPQERARHRSPKSRRHRAEVHEERARLTSSVDTFTGSVIHEHSRSFLSVSGAILCFRFRKPHMRCSETPNTSLIHNSSSSGVVTQRPTSGAIRTDSGTVIDKLSKQCTPAPSVGREFEDDADPFQDSEDQSMQGDNASIGAPQGLATPIASPFAFRLATPASSPVNHGADQVRPDSFA